MLTFTYKFFCGVSQQLNSGLHRLNVGASISHIVWHKHPVGLLCTSDQPVADAATYTTHNKRDKYLLPQRESNPDPNNEAPTDLSRKKYG